MRDKDGNVARCELQYETRFVVSVSANGCWFTPAQARRFAQQILRRTAEAERANAKWKK